MAAADTVLGPWLECELIDRLKQAQSRLEDADERLSKTTEDLELRGADGSLRIQLRTPRIIQVEDLNGQRKRPYNNIRLSDSEYSIRGSISDVAVDELKRRGDEFSKFSGAFLRLREYDVIIKPISPSKGRIVLEIRSCTLHGPLGNATKGHPTPLHKQESIEAVLSTVSSLIARHRRDPYLSDVNESDREPSTRSQADPKMNDNEEMAYQEQFNTQLGRQSISAEAIDKKMCAKPVGVARDLVKGRHAATGESLLTEKQQALINLLGPQHSGKRRTIGAVTSSRLFETMHRSTDEPSKTDAKSVVPRKLAAVSEDVAVIPFDPAICVLDVERIQHGATALSPPPSEQGRSAESMPGDVGASVAIRNSEPYTKSSMVATAEGAALRSMSPFVQGVVPRETMVFGSPVSADDVLAGQSKAAEWSPKKELLNPFAVMGRIPRRYIHIPPDQQKLLSDERSWFDPTNTNKTPNIPTSTLRDLKAFYERKLRQDSGEPTAVSSPKMLDSMATSVVQSEINKAVDQGAKETLLEGHSEEAVRRSEDDNDGSTDEPIEWSPSPPPQSPQSSLGPTRDCDWTVPRKVAHSQSMTSKPESDPSSPVAPENLIGAAALRTKTSGSLDTSSTNYPTADSSSYLAADNLDSIPSSPEDELEIASAQPLLNSSDSRTTSIASEAMTTFVLADLVTQNQNQDIEFNTCVGRNMKEPNVQQEPEDLETGRDTSTSDLNEVSQAPRGAISNLSREVSGHRSENGGIPTTIDDSVPPVRTGSESQSAGNQVKSKAASTKDDSQARGLDIHDEVHSAKEFSNFQDPDLGFRQPELHESDNSKMLSKLNADIDKKPLQQTLSQPSAAEKGSTCETSMQIASTPKVTAQISADISVQASARATETPVTPLTSPFSSDPVVPATLQDAEVQDDVMMISSLQTDTDQDEQAMMCDVRDIQPAHAIFSSPLTDAESDSEIVSQQIFRETAMNSKTPATGVSGPVPSTPAHSRIPSGRWEEIINTARASGRPRPRLHPVTSSLNRSPQGDVVCSTCSKKRKTDEQDNNEGDNLEMKRQKVTGLPSLNFDFSQEDATSISISEQARINRKNFMQQRHPNLSLSTPKDLATLVSAAVMVPEMQSHDPNCTTAFEVVDEDLDAPDHGTGLDNIQTQQVKDDLGMVVVETFQDTVVDERTSPSAWLRKKTGLLPTSCAPGVAHHALPSTPSPVLRGEGTVQESTASSLLRLPTTTSREQESSKYLTSQILSAQHSPETPKIQEVSEVSDVPQTVPNSEEQPQAYGVVEDYLNAYPDYGYNVLSIIKVVVYITWLQESWKAPHPSLWDDFIRSFLQDFTPHVTSQIEARQKPDTHLQFYNREVKVPLYNRHVITPNNLATVLEAYPELAKYYWRRFLITSADSRSTDVTLSVLRPVLVTSIDAFDTGSRQMAEATAKDNGSPFLRPALAGKSDLHRVGTGRGGKLRYFETHSQSANENTPDEETNAASRHAVEVVSELQATNETEMQPGIETVVDITAHLPVLELIDDADELPPTNTEDDTLIADQDENEEIQVLKSSQVAESARKMLWYSHDAAGRLAATRARSPILGGSKSLGTSQAGSQNASERSENMARHIAADSSATGSHIARDRSMYHPSFGLSSAPRQRPRPSLPNTQALLLRSNRRQTLPASFLRGSVTESTIQLRAEPKPYSVVTQYLNEQRRQRLGIAAPMYSTPKRTLSLTGSRAASPQVARTPMSASTNSHVSMATDKTARAYGEWLRRNPPNSVRARGSSHARSVSAAESRVFHGTPAGSRRSVIPSTEEPETQNWR